MHRFVAWLANFMALLGGLALTALVILTCLSVLGRGGNTFAHWAWFSERFPELSQQLLATGIGPINGDFEILEAGIAFAIFAFLPLCQLHGAHATVDVFTSILPTRFNQLLRTFWEILLAAVIVLICWRLFEGMQGKIRNGETTFLLQFPIWWAYAVSFVASLVAALVAVYCAWFRLKLLFSGRLDQDNLEGLPS